MTAENFQIGAVGPSCGHVGEFRRPNDKETTMKIRHLITALLTIVLALNVTAGPASASWWEDVAEGWERLWDDDNDLGTGVNGGEEDPGIGDDDDSAGGDEGGLLDAIIDFFSNTAEESVEEKSQNDRTPTAVEHSKVSDDDRFTGRGKPVARKAR
jgi:hypothetical protein|tara:strand:- start:842 stop:1309 length:468 start_codon:yes stop_codon:yes gene_type:complete